MNILRLIICVLSLQLVGCASIVNGTHQSLSVQTFPIKGAKCQLSNGDGTWVIPSTPGTVTVDRDYSDLRVSCRKDLFNGNTTVKSKSNGMALGNVLLVGSLVWTAVDISNGAAFDYPNIITVKLDKDKDKPKAKST